MSRCIVKPRVPGWPLYTCLGYPSPAGLGNHAPVPCSARFWLARPATLVRMFGMTSATLWRKTRHYSVPELCHGPFISPSLAGNRSSFLSTRELSQIRSRLPHCLPFIKIIGVLVISSVNSAGIMVYRYRGRASGTVSEALHLIYCIFRCDYQVTWKVPWDKIRNLFGVVSPGRPTRDILLTSIRG